MKIDTIDAPCGACDPYRYTLTRALRGTGRPVLFGLANPSVADAHRSDRTLAKCVGFATRLDAYAVAIANPHAYRAQNPHDLYGAHRRGVDTVGPGNEEAIRGLLRELDPIVIVGWGGVLRPLPPEPIERFIALLRFAERPDGVPRQLFCLGMTSRGEPRHPLMLPYATPLVPWDPAQPLETP